MKSHIAYIITSALIFLGSVSLNPFPRGKSRRNWDGIRPEGLLPGTDTPAVFAVSRVLDGPSADRDNHLNLLFEQVGFIKASAGAFSNLHGENG